MIEEPPFRNRIAAIYATLEARERKRRRFIAGGATVMLLIVAISLYAIIYFTFIGDQHHVLEIQIGEATYRIESRTGPFTVEVPGEERAIPTAAGNGGFLTEHLHRRQVVPRTYLWAPIAETTQVVKVPGREDSCEFVINGIPFHATEDRIRTGGRTRVAYREWLSQPGRVEVIDVDRLQREARN